MVTAYEEDALSSGDLVRLLEVSYDEIPKLLGLAEVLGAAHRRGVGLASADVNESNDAAVTLFEGLGARRTGSNLELVLR